MPVQLPIQPADQAVVEEAPVDANLPLRLSATAESTLRAHLESTHRRYEAAISPFRRKIEHWRDLYDGLTQQTWKPWSEASAIFFPLARMISDTARSRVYQSFFQQKDVVLPETSMQATDYRLITGEDLDSDLDAFRRAANNILLDERQVDLRSALDAVLSEATQIGTAIILTHHDLRKAPKKKVRGLDGSVELRESEPITDRVRIRCIPAEYCIWDTTAEDPEDIRYFSREFSRSAVEIQQLAKEQDWPAEKLETILGAPDTTPTEAFNASLRRSHIDTQAVTDHIRMDGSRISLHSGAMFNLREVYLMNVDVDGDGAYEDTVITWHPKSGTLPRIVLLPYIHGKMPIDFIWYEQRRNRPLGEGTIEPIETLCMGVNAIANQAIDAQSIRNCPTIITPEGADVDAEIGEGWHPGMHLHERAPNEIRTLEFGQTGNTIVSLSIFDKLIEVAFRITHLGAAQFGDVSVAQRTPTDLGQSIMSEGARLLDKIISRIRSTMSRICTKAMLIVWQEQPQLIAQAIGPEDAMKVDRLIRTLGPDKLSLVLRATSATHSKALEHQNLLEVNAAVDMYAQQTVQAVQMISGGTDPKTGQAIPPNPLMQQLVGLWAEPRQRLIKHILETSPVVNDAEKYIPDTAALMAIGATPQQPPMGMPGMDAGMGGAPPGSASMLPLPPGF